MFATLQFNTENYRVSDRFVQVICINGRHREAPGQARMSKPGILQIFGTKQQMFTHTAV